MGVHDPSVVHSEALSDSFSFYVLYGRTEHQIDLNAINVVDTGHHVMDKEAVEAYIDINFSEPLVFVGASTGTDAHTVGIDAIMNMKGYNGHYGLERYKGIKAYNLGGTSR